jgi:hypothetical protein
MPVGSNHVRTRTCRSWASTLREGLQGRRIRQAILPDWRAGSVAIPVFAGEAVQDGSVTLLLVVSPDLV